MDREMMEEVAMEVDQEVEREEGAVVVGSAENDEVEAKTQGNHHPHQTSRQKMRKDALEMSLQCGIMYEKWSGDTPQVWKTRRRARGKVEVYM